MLIQTILASFATLLLSGQIPQDDRCQPTAAGNERRQDAIRFLVSFNQLQADSQRRTGTYSALSELSTASTIPVGFVPRLVFDRWAYVVTLSDLFDRCGVSLMSDERGGIYEARPLIDSDSRSPNTSREPGFRQRQ